MENFEDLTRFNTLAEQTKENLVTFLRKNYLKGSMYNLIQDRRKPTKATTFGEMARLCKQVYTAWYRYAVRETTTNLAENEQMKNWVVKKDNAPEKLSDFDCLNMIFCGYKGFEYFGLIRPQGLNLEGLYFDEKYKDKFFYDDFFHIKPFAQKQKTTKRIYLNVSLDNVPELVNELMQKCLGDDEYLYTKFWTNNERNDVMLIYTNDEKLPKMMQYLDEIYAKKPKLFLNGEGDLRFTAKIRDWAGITDNPEYKRSSFNTELANAFENFAIDYKKMYFQKIEREFGSQNMLRETVYSLLNSSIANQIKAGLNHYDTLKNPSEFDEANRKFYAELSQKFLTKDSEMYKEIKNLADTILGDMKVGKINDNDSRKLRVSSSVPYLTERDKKADEKAGGVKLAKINSGQKILQTFSFEPHILEQLLDKCNLKNEAISNINYAMLAPYLETQHLSPDYPFFNIETLERYKNNLQALKVEPVIENAPKSFKNSRIKQLLQK